MSGQRARQLHDGVDVPAQQARYHLRRVERDVHDLRPGRPEQPHRRKMGVAARAGIADVQLAGVGLCVLHQFAQAFPPRLSPHEQQRRLDLHARHRSERLVIESQHAGVIGRRNRIGVPHQVMAVGSLPRGVLVADRAAAARPVHHDDLRSQLLAHAFGQHAGGDVGGAAGGKQHDEFDRLLSRKRFLRRCHAGNGKQRRGRE
ncbi:hypothetical protein D3C83_07490 [compost metagenome]